MQAFSLDGLAAQMAELQSEAAELRATVDVLALTLLVLSEEDEPSEPAVDVLTLLALKGM